MKNLKAKTIYIFPGFQETTKRKPYQELRKSLEAKGYQVILKNLNWKEKYSQQLFVVERDSILIGFSMGAVFVKLLAEQNKVNKVLLLSMTPLKYFKFEKNIKELIAVCGKSLVQDIVKNLKNKRKLKNEVYFYGEKENTKGDIIVKNTGHELTKNYLEEIKKVFKR